MTTEITSAYDRLDVYEAVKHMYSSPLDFIDDLDALATDTMTTDEVIAVIKSHKAGQSPVNKQWKVFQPGTAVAWRESIIFGGRVHYGEVKSVQFAQNGYPVTTVQFPTYREGQPREWAVEALATPDQYDENPGFWAV